jgi:hypothetical protein
MLARKTEKAAEAVVSSRKIGCRTTSINVLVAMVTNCRMKLSAESTG